MVVLVSSTSTNGAVIRRIVMLAAQTLIDRSMSNYCAGMSGKGNRINPRWRSNKKRNGHLSPRSRTNIYHFPASRPPLFLIGHYLQLFKAPLTIFLFSFKQRPKIHYESRAPKRHFYSSQNI